MKTIGFDPTLCGTVKSGNVIPAVYHGLHKSKNREFRVFWVAAFGYVFIPIKADTKMIMSKDLEEGVEYQICLLNEDIMNLQFGLVVKA